MAMSTTSTKIGKAATASVSRQKGIFMILSPAKTLDLTPLPPEDLPDGIDIHISRPSCNEMNAKTQLLANILKSKNQKQLKDMLKVSDKISASVKSYYNSFRTQNNDSESDKDKDKDQTNFKPAVFSFDGPAFKGIHPSSCDSNTLHYMQTHLRIMDPLYGALKPLDEIQPYRLEMATKAILKDIINMDGDGNGKSNDDVKYKSLANWWKESITSNILSDMKMNMAHADADADADVDKCTSTITIMVNLASDEYSAAVDTKRLVENNCKFIKVAFQQEGKVIAVHAKRARGLMVRYISEHQLVDIEGIQQFNLDGYAYREEKSKDGLIVFDRRKNWKDEEDVGENDNENDNAIDGDKAAGKKRKKDGEGKGHGNGNGSSAKKKSGESKSKRTTRSSRR